MPAAKPQIEELALFRDYTLEVNEVIVEAKKEMVNVPVGTACADQVSANLSVVIDVFLRPVFWVRSVMERAELPTMRTRSRCLNLSVELKQMLCFDERPGFSSI